MNEGWADLIIYAVGENICKGSPLSITPWCWRRETRERYQLNIGRFPPRPLRSGGCRVSVPNVVVQQRGPPCQIVGGAPSNAGALALVPALQELALVCIHHQLQCILIL